MVVYAGTHDNETIVGYFRDKSDYELAYLYEYLNIHYKEEIPDALIRAAYASIADVAIIQMQDLMKLGGTQLALAYRKRYFERRTESMDTDSGNRISQITNTL